MTVGFWSFVFLCVHQTLIGLYCTKEGLCLKPDGELDVGRHLLKKKKSSLSVDILLKKTCQTCQMPIPTADCMVFGLRCSAVRVTGVLKEHFAFFFFRFCFLQVGVTHTSSSNIQPTIKKCGSYQPSVTQQ